MLRPLVEGCVEVYTAVCTSLRPTPSKSHYRFNFRDLSRLLGGLLSIAPAACGGDVPAALTRLWAHEVRRVFGDRLVCEEDQQWLRQLQLELLVSKFGWRSAPPENMQPDAVAPAGDNEAGHTAVKSMFQASAAGQACIASAALLHGPEQVLFGDFSKMGVCRQERVYEPLASIAKLALLFGRYLDIYNISGGKAASAATAAATAAAADGCTQAAGRHNSNAAAGKGQGVDSCSNSHMDLVFFEDAVLHVVRLARVLRQPR